MSNDCNVVLTLAGSLSGDAFLRIARLLYENDLLIPTQPDPETGAATAMEHQDVTDAVLEQAMRAERDDQGRLELHGYDCDGEIDSDLWDALGEEGLTFRWEWSSDGNFGPGFDIWDPALGKGQRFWLDPDGTALMPVERAQGPTLNHYVHFHALHSAMASMPLFLGSSAHALLADKAAFMEKGGAHALFVGKTA